MTLTQSSGPRRRSRRLAAPRPGWTACALLAAMATAGTPAWAAGAAAPGPAAAPVDSAAAADLGPPYGAATSYLLGTLLLDRGEVAAALPYLQLARRLAPASLEVAGAYLQALTAAGARDEALALLEELIAADPDSVRLREQRVGLLLEADRPEAALAEIARARADLGAPAALSLYEAEALARAGRFAAAIDAYRSALAQAPERAEQIYLVLAGLLARADRQDELPALWREALAALPAAGRLRRAAVQDLIRRGQADLAFDLALAGDQAGAADDPEDGEEEPSVAAAAERSFVVEAARQLVQDGRTEQAVGALQALRSEGRLGRGPRLWLSRLLVQQERVPEAVALLRETVQEWPQEAAAHLYLGEALTAQEDFAAGEAALRRAVALAPDDADCLVALVRVLAVQLGNEETNGAATAGAAGADAGTAQRTEARREEIRRLALRAAPALPPESARSHLILGFAFRGLDDLPRAAEMFAAAARDPESRRESLLQLAACQEELARFDQARETFETLRRENPDDPVIANALGYFLAERNVELPRAEKLVREALAKDPSSPFYLDSLGWVAYRRGDYQAAFDLLVRAANGLPDAPEILEHMGLTLAALGRREEAERALRRAIAAGGDAARLQAALARLLGGEGTP